MTAGTDKRRKLTDEQREEIKRRYVPGNGRKLAAEFGVTPAAISWVVNPEKKIANGKASNERIKWRLTVDPEFLERRKTYMREYMRKRRAAADIGMEE